MTVGGNAGKWNAVKGENLAILYARIALGAAFLRDCLTIRPLWKRRRLRQLCEF
jgi:hypothetical protein